jgi:hypothetical protein
MLIRANPSHIYSLGYGRGDHRTDAHGDDALLAA